VSSRLRFSSLGQLNKGTKNEQHNSQLSINSPPIIIKTQFPAAFSICSGSESIANSAPPFSFAYGGWSSWAQLPANTSGLCSHLDFWPEFSKGIQVFVHFNHAFGGKTGAYDCWASALLELGCSIAKSEFLKKSNLRHGFSLPLRPALGPAGHVPGHGNRKTASHR